MTQIAIKNHGHPSAEMLLANIQPQSPTIESRLLYSQEIGGEEAKNYQYLYTKYRDELYRELTILDYDEWILEELQRNALLRKFVHQEGIFTNNKRKVIELLCSKGLSLFNGSKEVASQIVQPYGEEYIQIEGNNLVAFAEQAVDKSVVTDIVMRGNQMLHSAIDAFYSSERGKNSITCAIACSSNNFEAEQALIEKLQFLLSAPGPEKVIIGKEYCETEGDTVLYVRQYTRRDKCKRIY